MQVEAGSVEMPRMLTRILIPKPIVMVTTVSPDGVVNAAPYSLVSIVSMRPALVGLTISRKPGGVEKDTLANIRATGELVLNLLTEEHARVIPLAAAAFPREESELTAGELETVPSVTVRPPRIVGSPAQLECRLLEVKEFGPPAGPGSSFVIAEVLAASCEDRHWNGDAPVGFRPLGRLGGDLFCTTGEIFEMKALDYEAWLQGKR